MYVISTKSFHDVKDAAIPFGTFVLPTSMNWQTFLKAMMCLNRMKFFFSIGIAFFCYFSGRVGHRVVPG